jgi:hypothetical protein
LEFAVYEELLIAENALENGNLLSRAKAWLLQVIHQCRLNKENNAHFNYHLNEAHPVIWRDERVAARAALGKRRKFF